jgi:WD40 repeat protein
MKVDCFISSSSQIWDLASGHLKVSLTGHISSVRGLAVSARHPYLFSCGEDRQVKCWDLEYNKVWSRKRQQLGEGSDSF